MIDELDTALEALMRTLPMAAVDLDISFAWPGSLSQTAVRRPTVNLFMWDANVNTKMASTGVLSRHNDDGSTSRKRPDPFIDVRYLVTIWCDRERDEHRLLGQLLKLVLAVPQIDIPDREDGTGRTATLHLERPEARRLDAVWHGMESRLRPAVDLVVTTAVDVFDWEGTSTAVQEIKSDLGSLPATKGRIENGPSRRSVEYIGRAEKAPGR